MAFATPYLSLLYAHFTADFISLSMRNKKLGSVRLFFLEVIFPLHMLINNRGVKKVEICGCLNSVSPVSPVRQEFIEQFRPHFSASSVRSSSKAHFFIPQSP
jgi:hypothetical protein